LFLIKSLVLIDLVWMPGKIDMQSPAELYGIYGACSMTTRIMLVDDHAIMRNGIESLIVSQTDMEVVGQAENGQIAVELAAELNPDVIIMDVCMPEMNGIEATRLIKSRNPNSMIIGISAFEEPEYVTGMIDAGASGYVCNDNLVKELVGAIQKVI
jgi:DNA-binding NarL/FixJ family response regulator